VVFLKRTFPMDLTLVRPARRARLCEWAGYQVGPTVLEELRAEVFCLWRRADEDEINDGLRIAVPGVDGGRGAPRCVRNCGVGVLAIGIADRWCVMLWTRRATWWTATPCSHSARSLARAPLC